MTEDYNESTRVMPAGGDAPFDRTMVATAAPPAGATQMGATVSCAVCGTTNPGLETYCVECGFLLESTPGSLSEAPESESESAELVESASGRRFRLRQGTISVGRENCDILLLDGTVSRRHAEINVSGDEITVTDLGSTNGTQVDGNRLSPNQPARIVPGTVVRFGNAALTLPGAAGDAPAEATILSGEAETEQTLISPAGDSEISPEPPPPIKADASLTAAVARLVGPAGEIMLRSGAVTIGRRPGNDVVLDDAYVSGRHAELSCGDSGCTITDLGSTNGTTVNGVKLEPNSPQALVAGDEVQIGQNAYQFEIIQQIPEPSDVELTEPQEMDPAEVDEIVQSVNEDR